MNAAPERFNDDLAARIFPMRFRRIGNPYHFLNEVGIIPVLEFIYKGHLLLDVAEALNVSYTVLTRWVEEEGHAKAIDEAETVSAEGFLARATRELQNAKTSFELAKAREMLRHAQFMAAKKNKSTYGTADQQGGGGGVSYVFNINGAVSAPQMKTIVDSTAEKVDLLEQNTPPRVGFNFLEHLLGAESEPIPDETPIGSMNFGADEPETGPFYE